MKLWLSHIAISNIKGIRQIDFPAGAVTVLEGDNGEGKSSCLDAIASVFHGGHDPRLIRLGEKRGEVALTETNGTTLKKIITEKSSDLQIKTKDGVTVPAPKAYVERVASGFAFDPLAFAAADPKKRAEFLLEVMPITITEEELKAADVTDRRPVAMDLEGLDSLREQIYEARKAANRSCRDAEGTVATLSASLPEQDDQDWSAQTSALIDERTEVERQIGEAQEAVRAAAQREIQEIADDISAQIAALNEEKSARLARVREQESLSLAANEDTARPERERLASAIATARERSAAQMKASGTRELIERMREATRERFIAAETLSRQLEGLDKLRKAKLDALPIDGLTVKDGEVYFKGIPFDSLNTAEQYVRSFQIAALRETNLMIADRAEALGPAKWEEFCGAAYEAAQEFGLQVIVAKRTTGPLKATLWRPELKPGRHGASAILC